MIQKNIKIPQYSFLRIFHPVGQGAFFTEQILSEHRTILNIAYDCGSCRKKDIESEIKKCVFWGNISHIHILFISHLDKDHVNGIDCLINNKLIDEETVVILPFSYLSLLKYLVFDKNIHFPIGVRTALQHLVLVGVKFVGIINEDECIDFPSENFVSSFNDLLDKTKGNIIVSSHNLSYNSLWIYIPYMIDNNQIYNDFANNARNQGIEIRKLHDPEYVRDNIGALKDIYSKTGKKKSNVSLININSLQLVSLSDPKIIPYNIDIDKETCYSCLYTGDTKMDDDLLKLKSKVKVPLFLFQIPHHGSIHSFNKKILGKISPMSIFTSYRTTYKRNKKIPTIYNNLNMPFKGITERSGFRFEIDFYKN